MSGTTRPFRKFFSATPDYCWYKRKGTMAYTLNDSSGHQVTSAQLQNRGVWYTHGNVKEQAFINAHGGTFGVKISPVKIADPTAPDLQYGQHLADLKCQNTPLFLAQERYGLPPQWAVTFNLKDALEYGPRGKNYPDFTIFFWVDWVAVKMNHNGKVYTVDPMVGVWAVPFSTIEDTRRQAPIHWYAQREKRVTTDPSRTALLEAFEPRLREGKAVFDIRGLGGNAACSYVFDLRKFPKVA
jgi:hypothetical protein